LATVAAIMVLAVQPVAAADASVMQTLINQDRAANGGLAPLAWSPCLAAVAMLNAQRIANQGSLSHTNGPELDLACGNGATNAGENIGWESVGIDDAGMNTGYMNSPGHRANILGAYQYTATAWVVAPNGYGYNAEEFLGSPALALTPPPAQQTSFYFAEGYTGGGFTETLSLLMPNQSGTATIDYYTKAGHLPTVSVGLTAGHVLIRNVNTDVGANQEVSARVTFPAPGVAERTIHFNTGTWHGSTDKVGATSAATEWDFAEGSTLSAYSEYLSLQNPGASSAAVTLNYFTDSGQHPVKHLTLGPNSRTTIEVMSGDLSNNASCTPGAGGTCGVGGGIGGVSVQVLSGAPIIAERPFYVNGFDFGSGTIRDGHDAFGANAPATQWNFAEGTTLNGFNEYLTLENPNALPAATTLRYADNTGAVTTKALAINAQSRVTVPVFGTGLGVGQGVGGVSVQVTANLPIVAERPMYIVHDFGTGVVAGATVAVGATTLGYIYGFASASTASGENDYLTILNPGLTQADVLVSYYTSSGMVGQLVPVPASSRQTVLVFSSAGGVGPGVASLGIVVWSDQPVLVEKPTYSSNSSTYGATDAPGLNASSF